MATPVAAQTAQEVVMAPPALVSLVGAQRLRRLHAGLLKRLLALEVGGTVSPELDAESGGKCNDLHFTVRERG